MGPAVNSPCFVRATARFALASIALVSCGVADVADGAPPRDASPVQTDSLAYRLAREPEGYRAHVTATYTNRSGAPVYFARCNSRETTPMYLVKRTGADSARRSFADGAWACVGRVPAGAIAPGSSVSVRVAGGQRRSTQDDAAAESGGSRGPRARARHALQGVRPGLGRLRSGANGG